MKKALIFVILLASAAQAKMRYVDGTPLSNADKAAINQNFNDADRLLSNKVPMSAESVTLNISTLTLSGSLVADSLTADAVTTTGRYVDKTGYVCPVGTIVMYGAATAPDGWFLCDGSTASRTTNSDLYGVIGTTFGTGDGSTTFNKPDFRGVFPKGAGTTTRAAGVDANGTAYSATLGTYYQDKMQGHSHNGKSFAADAQANSGSGVLTSNSNNTIVMASDGVNGTPRTGSTTEPQSLGVWFIIKY